MIELAGLTALVLLAWALLAIGLVLLKTVLWMVLLPFRLLVYAVALPVLLLLKTVLGGVLFFVIVPVVALAGLVSLVAVGAAILVPLLPLLFLGLAAWFVVRLMRGAPAPTRV